MSRARGLLWLAIVISVEHGAAAEEPANAARSAAVSAPMTPVVWVIPAAPPQRRSVHADYDALGAGAVLLGLGYALALSVPVHRNFSADSRHLAIPIAGPWLSDVSWQSALDGLVQLGGVAFVVDAFENPITVLGTPETQMRPRSAANHGASLVLQF